MVSIERIELRMSRLVKLWMIKLWTAIFLLAPAATLVAQSPSNPQSAPPSYTARTTLVLVPALVTKRSGEPVFTLKATDFHITDDGVEQQVSLEEDTGGEPLALVVAIETGSAGGRKLDSYSKIGPLIEALVGNVEHKVAVVSFDSEPDLAQGFTPDLNVVNGAIGSLKAGNGGGAILDALAFSVELLRTQPISYRRAVLLISETVDRGSKAKLGEALRAVSDTNTAIYSLAFSSTRSVMKHESAGTLQSSTPGPPGGCMAKDPDAEADPTSSRFSQAYDCLSLLAPPLRLAKMAVLASLTGLRRNVPETVAQITGGEYFHFENAGGLERALLILSNHLPNRYVLSFHPQSPHPGLHAVSLRLPEYPDLRVAARGSYWADTGTATPGATGSTPQ